MRTRPTGFAGTTANVGAAGIGTTGSTMVGGAAGGSAGAVGMSMAGAAGSGAMGAAGLGGSSAGGSDASDYGEGETGRLVGMTEAHNVVRARIMNPTPDPPLPPLKWSVEVAKVAQAYADKLATDCSFQHSMTPGLGENLAYYEGFMADPEDAVEGWAGEEECYTFGPLMRGDNCDMACTARQSSNGCGHYTQVVWRNTTELGCGVATCSGARPREIWVCNYKAPGNYIGMEPY